MIEYSIRTNLNLLHQRELRAKIGLTWQKTSVEDFETLSMYFRKHVFLARERI